MASLAARRGVPIVLMHMQGTPGTMQKNPRYGDVVAEITDFFEERIKFAIDKGIAHNQIILDPGIGFGKTVEHNLTILRRLKEFTAFGRPLLVGLSNKSFIGKIAGMENPSDRLSGSLCGGIWSALNGAAILRVHDVYATAQAVKILSAIRKSRDAA
jgi:dihydropteroate synthase